MFASLPQTPCAFCHEAPENSNQFIAEPIQSERRYQETRDALLDEARAAGLGDIETFDWLADRALELPVHLLNEIDGDSSTVRRRPEFDTLFTKFRIGKTYFTFEDPITGNETRADVTRCNTCHIVASSAADQLPGTASGAEIVERIRELTALSARAERILLTARRGGVETREALLDVERAVDAQISLQVLVHGFSTAEDSPFMEQYREGMDYAGRALSEGQLALDELVFRRQGLAISLLLIVCVLVALALKIREISNRS